MERRPARKILTKTPSKPDRKIRGGTNADIAKRHARVGRKLRGGFLHQGLPDLDTMVNELEDMTDVLLGRDDPPVNSGLMTLYEVADAYFARAAELTAKLQRLEREGEISRGDDYYKFRTGELRTFVEMAKRAADLGSRRISHQQLLVDQERTGRTLGYYDED